MTNEDIKFQRRRWILVLFLICGALLVILLAAASALFVLFYDSWAGNTRIGAAIQFQRAMDRSDGKAAVYFARKLVDHYTDREGKISYNFVLTQLIWAYELNNEYEKAVETCLLYTDNKKHNTKELARIYYKQKKYTKSFQTYCYLALEPKFQGKNGHLVLRDDIMCKYWGKNQKRICPFENYDQFKMFVNSEYQKLGRPKKYTLSVERYNNDDE
jgi:hypothetical protein